MSVPTIVEPTPEQLARIADLEARTKSIREAISELYTDVTWLKDSGLEVLDAGADPLEQMRHFEDDVRCLRVSGGRVPFSDWFFHRVQLLEETKELSDSVGTDDLSHLRQVLAIEEAMRAAAPKLMGLLEIAATAEEHHPLSDATEARIGMPEEVLEVQLGDALTKLIESGWRP